MAENVDVKALKQFFVDRACPGIVDTIDWLQSLGEEHLTSFAFTAGPPLSQDDSRGTSWLPRFLFGFKSKDGQTKESPLEALATLAGGPLIVFIHKKRRTHLTDGVRFSFSK